MKNDPSFARSQDNFQIDLFDTVRRLKKTLVYERYGMRVSQIQKRDSELAKIPSPTLGLIMSWIADFKHVDGRNTYPIRWKLRTK